MKTIIMSQTIPLICKDETEVAKLLKTGYKLKEVDKIQYLIKINEIIR